MLKGASPVSLLARHNYYNKNGRKIPGGIMTHTINRGKSVTTRHCVLLIRNIRGIPRFVSRRDHYCLAPAAAATRLLNKLQMWVQRSNETSISCTRYTPANDSSSLNWHESSLKCRLRTWTCLRKSARTTLFGDSLECAKRCVNQQFELGAKIHPRLRKTRLE